MNRPLSRRTLASTRGDLVATILLLGAAAACGESGISAEVSPHVGTVVTVRWTTSEPSTDHVEYGASPALGLRTPSEATPSTHHLVRLMGLRPDTEYFYRVVSTRGSNPPSSSPIRSVRTRALPPGLPARFQVTGAEQPGLIVTPLLGATRAVVMVDGSGYVVWYFCLGGAGLEDRACAGDVGTAPDPSRLDAYRARISNDGRSVLFNLAKVSGEPSDRSAIVRVSLDGSDVRTNVVPFLAHDFVEHDDGTIAALAFEDREDPPGGGGARVRGNRIVQIAPDGVPSTVWSTWDCFDPTALPGDTPEIGWTVANALDFDQASGTYLVGLRNLSSITSVDPATRTCRWVFGTAGSTFAFAEGSARFLHQHQFHLYSSRDGVTRMMLMDNDGMGGASRVLEYELDFAAMQAREVWRYVSTPRVYTFVLGETMRLADGGTFINWSAAGQMERLDDAGNSVWKMNTEAGVIFGFHALVEDATTALIHP